MHPESRQHSRSAALENAFELFNEVSTQLTGSYRQLERRVEQLTRELASSRGERMQQLAEKERLAERLAQLLDALPAGVVLLDGQDRLRECNPAAAALLGDPRPGSRWTDICARVFSRIPSSAEDCRFGDGRVVNISQRALEQEQGRILLLQEVTETRRLQQRLDRRERLAAMGEMAAQLAHQIRTPLSSAMLYASHLARDDLEPGQRRRFSTRLRSRLQHMERQVADILAFSRGDTQAHAPVALARLLDALESEFDSQLRECGAVLETSPGAGQGIVVQGHYDALLGALANLIANALQHGAGCIVLDVAVSPDGWLQLRIDDNGTGIPDDLRERVFDPFFTTRSDGTGLGLAVVQSVLLAHRGNVRLVDSRAGGACFAIELPLLRDAGAADTRGPACRVTHEFVSIPAPPG